MSDTRIWEIQYSDKSDKYSGRYNKQCDVLADSMEVAINKFRKEHTSIDIDIWQILCRSRSQEIIY